MATFNEEVIKAASENVTLCWLHPKQRLIADWSVVSGTIYKRSVSHFVTDVLNDNTSLTQAASSSVGSNEWFYDSINDEVYVDVGADPAISYLVVEYRLFFSNAPYTLPYDLNTGTEVTYLPEIEPGSTSSFRENIDADDLTGISITSSGAVNLILTDLFKEIYDNYYWVSTKVQLFIWFPNLDPSEAQIIFKGTIESKNYQTGNSPKVGFNIRNDLDKLKNEIPLDLYTESDGDIGDDIIGVPKRRIYGRALVLCDSTEKQLDGYALTGTAAKTNTQELTFTGGALLTQAAPQDTIKFTYEDEEYEYSIDSIDSDTVMQVSEEIEVPVSGATVTIVTRIPTIDRNRTFFISDHVLFEKSTTVTVPIGFNRFEVADVNDFEAGDVVKVNGVTKTIRRISGDEIVLNTNLASVPSIGWTVVKDPVQNAWADDLLMVAGRDYTVTNAASGSFIVVDDLAEFNLAKPFNITTGSFTFNNASRNVSVTGINVQAIFDTGMWISSDDILHTTWYKIKSVPDEGTIVLETAYGGGNNTGDAKKKEPRMISDETRLLVDCYGLTEDGTKNGVFIRTGSQIVEHLLKEQGLTNDMDLSSFAQAELDVPYTMSLKLPIDKGSDRPSVNEIIEVVNLSILGSLTTNLNQQLVYSVLSPRKSTIDPDVIYRFDQVFNFSVESNGKNLARKSTSYYRHNDSDIFKGEPTTKVTEHVNELIDNSLIIKREEKNHLYLWDDVQAQIQNQRIAFLRSAANAIVKLQSNSIFFIRSLNDLVLLDIPELFNRKATEDQNFVGIVSGLSKSTGSNETRMEVTNLSGFMDRIGTFADTAAVNRSVSDDIARAKNGYYTDSNGIITVDKDFGINVYG